MKEDEKDICTKLDRENIYTCDKGFIESWFFNKT